MPSSTYAPTQAMYPSLSGRRVFISGGASGIGEAMVEAFAEQSCQVAFIDIADAASALLADRVASRGCLRPWWRRCDVRDIRALQAAIMDAAATLGDFHVLINNVASDDRHQLSEVSPEYWDERMAINQRPAFFSIQAVVPGMKRLGGGSIINLGSTGWRNKAGGYPGYAVAKSSVNGLTRGLAKELGGLGIRINTVSPGWVMTERQMNLWLTPEGEQEIVRNQCLVERLQPRDIAAMALFLASEDARMCTAQEFVVDGGWT